VNWIDVFIRNEYKEVIIESLKDCQTHKGLNIHAYCIMTSHVHLIISVNENFVLSDVINKGSSPVRAGVNFLGNTALNAEFSNDAAHPCLDFTDAHAYADRGRLPLLWIPTGGHSR
jgi:squalene cyclase